jgi:predicted helicase
MQHLQRPNRLLCVGRAGLVASGEWNLAFCADHFCDHNIFCRGSSMNFPLYLYETPKKTHPSGTAVMLALFESATDYVVRRPNISPAFLKELSNKLGLPQAAPLGLPKNVTPEEIFHYVYAVLHSPAYRTRYSEFLKTDFPKIPLTGDPKLFRELAELGRQLAALHLLDANVAGVLNKPTSTFAVAGSNVVEKVRYVDKLRRVYINNDQYFDNVPKEAWEFHIGGYQVCDKWLKDRKGRKITIDDIQHYQRIVVALLETIRLMQAIDERIPGFPLP